MLERGSAIALATMLMLAGSRIAAAATITINAKLQGDAIDIHASAMLNADAATAWRVLTDYDHYAEFIPDLRVSRVVARDGAKITVEQSGDAALWLFKMPIHVTFEVNEMPPHSLQSRTVAGSVRVLASSYALAPIAAGVRLDYAGQIVPGFELVGRIEQMVAERNAARQFQALADEIERTSATPGDMSLPNGNEPSQAPGDAFCTAGSSTDLARPHRQRSRRLCFNRSFVHGQVSNSTR